MTHGLLIILACALAQAPPEEPRPIKEGHAVFEVETLDGIRYLMRKDELLPTRGRVTYQSDEPADQGTRVSYTQEQILDERPHLSPEREERWRRQRREQYEEEGLVEVTTVNGAILMYPKEMKERADRARNEAALLEARETPPETPPAPPVSQDPVVMANGTTEPGLLTLWGPQVVVLLGALVLIAVVVKFMILDD